MTRPIIFDTDPGQDDAIALLVALASPELDILGITCVAGNVPLPLTARNARIICELAGRRDVPVFAGADAPLVRELVTAEHVHGATGIDGPVVTEPTMALQPQHAVDWMVETLLAAEDSSVTLCPVGPLTNIAMAMERAPGILTKIKEIVLMGGAYWEGGNSTPVAEFNIYVDPQAAGIVFNSGVPIVALPLDVTHKALMEDAWLTSVADIGTPVANAAASMMRFTERFDQAKYGTNGGPLHDPNVIAYLLQPSLYNGKLVNVTIEQESELTMGQTVVDWWRITGRPENCLWINEVDSGGFFRLLKDRLAGY